jgi:ADP-ribose pyrophosphatase
VISEHPGSAGYIKVVTRRFRMPDGTDADWDLLTGVGAVAVLAITVDEEVLLARQYRPGPDRVLDEMPGGVIEAGETPECAAARELAEETGYVGDVTVVGFSWVAGNAVLRRWAAIATNCRLENELELDDVEFCEPTLMSLPDFRDHLRSGQLTDCAAGYLCLDHAGLL